MQTLSKNLTKLRQDNKLSQQNVADLIDVPMKRYQHWEKNIEPPIENLISLAAIYGLTVDELINANPPEAKIDPIVLRYAAAPDNVKVAIGALLNL